MAQPSMRGFLAVLFWIVLGASILWRFLYRSLYVPAWDFLGAANGYYLIQTKGLIPALGDVLWNSRHYIQYPPIGSFLYSIVPGLLNCAVHWELWQGMMSFAIFALSLYLMLRYVGSRAFEASVVALALACSPALLAFSIAGYPSVSAFLPHILAFWLIGDRRFQRSVLRTVLLGLLTIEVSMHCHEVGKTFFVIPLLGVVFHRHVPWRVRAVWLFVSVATLYLAISHGSAGSQNGIQALGTIWPNLVGSAGTILRKVFLDRITDFPLLPIVGLAACWWLRRDKWIVIIALLIQWGLVVLLVRYGSWEVIPRRILLLEWYNLFIIASVLRDRAGWFWSGDRIRGTGVALLAVLAVTSAVQFLQLWRFTAVPRATHEFNLPYSGGGSDSVDYRVSPERVRWTDPIEVLARDGKTVILLYNYYAYPENATDPLGLLERLYLRLGHERFSKHVLVFGGSSERYSRVPVRDASELGPFVARRISDNSLSDLVVLTFDKDISEAFVEEERRLEGTLRASAHLEVCDSFHPLWTCYRIVGR